MSIYLIQEKIGGEYSGDFWIIEKNNRGDARHWIINNLDTSDRFQYHINDISNYPAIKGER